MILFSRLLFMCSLNHSLRWMALRWLHGTNHVISDIGSRHVQFFSICIIPLISSTRIDTPIVFGSYNMSESTRAPWARAPTDTSAASGVAGTKAPWATAGPAPGGVGVVTRAPWAVGVGGMHPSAANAASAPVSVDWASVQRLHEEYYQSLMRFNEAAKKNAHEANSHAAAAEAQAVPAAASSSSSDSSPPPPSPSSHLFTAPTKLIKTPAYMPLWRSSLAHAEIVQFILHLNQSVRSSPGRERMEDVKDEVETEENRKSSPSPYPISPAIRTIVTWLREGRRAILDIPPIQQSMRFGNKAFRTWFETRLSSPCLQQLHQKLLTKDLLDAGASDELAGYMQDAFGSWQRIDYGTGHELNFILWLLALSKVGVLTDADRKSLVLEVFREYILLMQELQATYWLEPAGSKGAWGLDDYQFLLFLFGTSQLIDGKLPNSSTLDAAVVGREKSRYLFMLGIAFIHRMKTGPFHEHSAFLYQISQLPSWNKANSGLIKMYDEEVLNKFPVVQHICFGRTIQFVQAPPTALTSASAPKTRPPPPSFDGTSASSTPQKQQ